MATKFSETVKKADMFGEAIGFEFKGSSSYRTLPGAFVSIIIIVLTLSYAIDKFSTMVMYEETRHLKIQEPEVNEE